jgi:hypothetical protein
MLIATSATVAVDGEFARVAAAVVAAAGWWKTAPSSRFRFDRASNVGLSVSLGFELA